MTEKNVLDVNKNFFNTELIRPALWVGISLLIMTVAAGIAFGAIHGTMVVPGDAVATGVNISAKPYLWIIEIVLWFIIIALDIIVSIGLYGVFVGTNRTLALATMVARLVYTACLLVAVLLLFGAFDASKALAAVNKFEKMWYAGLVIFGVHLILLTLLSFRSKFIHWIISVLLLFAGPAYVVIHILFLIGGEMAIVGVKLQSVFMIPMTLAEFGLALWLIFLAKRTKRNMIK